MLGRTTVQSYTFSAPSKSQLAYQLLAAVNAGRLKMYTTGSEHQEARSDEQATHSRSPLPASRSHSQEFWHQAQHARTTVRPNQTMNFYVDPREGHDDYLISLALTVHAAQDLAPREAKGRTRE